MSRQVCTTVYQFDELNEKAKEKARDWFRSCRDSNDFDTVIEDAARMMAILGFTPHTHAVKLMGGGTRHDPSIWWNLGYCQSDGVWIEADYSYAKGAHHKIRKEAPQDTALHEIADTLFALQKQYNYQLTARVKDSDRGGMTLDLDHPTLGGGISGDTDKAVYEIVHDLEQWIYHSLRTEDEYQNADEQVDDSIRANEYDFLENGDRA